MPAKNISSILSEIARSRIQEFRTYGVCARPALRTSFGRFIILATPRSGSTVLIHMLNEHPSIHCEFEVLSRMPLAPFYYLRGRSLMEAPDRIYGCKLMVHQVMRSRFPSPECLLAALHAKDWKIIVLRRRNIFMQAISSCIAQMTGRWTQTASGPLPAGEPICIEYDYLFKKIEQHERWISCQKQLTGNITRLTLIYEDDLLDQRAHQATLDGIFHYLNIPSVKVKASLAKILARPLREVISNYDQIYNKLKHTRYACYLEGAI